MLHAYLELFTQLFAQHCFRLVLSTKTTFAARCLACKKTNSSQSEQCRVHVAVATSVCAACAPQCSCQRTTTALHCQLPVTKMVLKRTLQTKIHDRGHSYERRRSRGHRAAALCCFNRQNSQRCVPCMRIDLIVRAAGSGAHQGRSLRLRTATSWPIVFLVHVQFQSIRVRGSAGDAQQHATLTANVQCCMSRMNSSCAFAVQDATPLRCAPRAVSMSGSRRTATFSHITACVHTCICEGKQHAAGWIAPNLWWLRSGERCAAVGISEQSQQSACTTDHDVHISALR